MKKEIYALFISISCVLGWAQTPPNDTVDTAILITGTETFSDVQTQDATGNSPGTSIGCDPEANLKRVYYKYSPTQDTNLSTEIVSPSGTFFIWIFEATIPNPTDDSGLTFYQGICQAGIDFTQYNFIGGRDYYFLISNDGGPTDIVFTEAAVKPGPSNQSVATAIDISTLPPDGIAQEVETPYASQNPGGMQGCDPESNARLVYYTYTPTANGTLVTQIRTPRGRSAIYAYTGAIPTPVSNSDLVALPETPCRRNHSYLGISVSAGVTYYIAVENDGANTDIRFTELSAQGSVPPNDQIADAFTIFNGTNFYPDVALPMASAVSSTGGGGGQPGCDTGLIPKVYYRFNTISSGTVTIDLNSPGGEAYALLYLTDTPNPVSDNQLFKAPGVICRFTTSETYTVSPGRWYFLLVASPTGFTDVIISTSAGTLSSESAEIPSDFLLYPTSVEDKLNYTSEQAVLRLQIFDLTGRLVQEHEQPEHQLDLSGLATGRYVVRAQMSDNTSRTAHFVKK
jgi:hypothetical protein